MSDTNPVTSTPLTVAHQAILASLLRNGPLPQGGASGQDATVLWGLLRDGYVALQTAGPGLAVWTLTDAGTAAAQPPAP